MLRVKYAFSGNLCSCSYLCSQTTKGFYFYGVFNHKGSWGNLCSWHWAPEHSSHWGGAEPHAPAYMCSCAWDSMRSALAGSFWEKRQWRSQEHTELILMPVLRSHCKQENTSLQATWAHKWNLTEKKLLSFLQARIGHTVRGLYAAQRMKIHLESKESSGFVSQLLARAMHSQCPLSLAVALERGETSFACKMEKPGKRGIAQHFYSFPVSF